MAERKTSLAPREERQLGRGYPSGWNSPFSALQRFADEVDRMFEDFGFGRRGGLSLFEGDRGEMWSPQVEVFQKDNELTIRADLPGLKKDEVSVEVTDSAVTIHGERKREHQEEQEGYFRSERSYGSFQRTVPLPEGAMSDQAKATFRDGVLEIKVPAPPVSKGRRLEITESTK
jgi:HSP20 family protein